MTQFNADQFVAANKAAVADFSALAVTAFAGFEKLAEFNLATAKNALSDSLESLQAVTAAKTPQDLLAVQAALVQPAAEKLAAYSRTVYQISSETGAELSKSTEAKLAEAQKTVSSAFDGLLKNAPAGSEAFVAAFKSAVSTGQQVLESAQASAKQALAQAEANVATATDAAVKAAKTAAKK
ncbi:phasin family protein [Curvibacter sp. HBC28]|uniref:Phasin family protein n=1 Tax=Curvibacter microcysteis TaxID=3026419 RepID=A0ABT5MDJ3_9BURK|nr:phasin family protein [Curvibacter sp. HBC28]MDD0814653.1 phasin family protein [Curvibacter sp. HBC28]